MALRLSIVSEHTKHLGSQGTKVFGVHGGSIGRGNDNEWILPDPQRYLSGKHARIDFRAGTYYLLDTSSNGTYVNGAQVPLGRFHEYALKDGDYIRLGEFELLVSIDKSNDFPPDEDAVVAYDGQSPSTAAKTSTAGDLGADLDLSDLLEPSEQLDIEMGQARRDAQTIPPGEGPSASDAETLSAPWHMLTRPLKVESETLARAQAQPPPAHEEIDPGLASLCRGAGIDPRTLPAEARGAVLQLAGQLLRETLLGLMDLNQGRQEFRSRFRISAPTESAGGSALNFAHGVDEALLRLLATLSTRAGAVEALRENFRELKAENTACLAAMRSAFEEFLARFEPKELEERFERAGKRGVFGNYNKARYWDLYWELYAGLAQRPIDGFPHLFIEAFAKAYDSKLRTLIPPRSRGLGSDKADEFGPAHKLIGDL